MFNIVHHVHRIKGRSWKYGLNHLTYWCFRQHKHFAVLWSANRTPSLSLSLLLSPSLCLPPSFSGVCWNGSRSAESAPCATNPFAACGQTPHKPPSSRRVSWRSEIGIPAVFDTPRSSGTFSFTVQQKGVLVKHIYIYLWCIISALHSVLWFKKANYQVWDHQLIRKCLKTAAAEEHF